MPLIDNNSLLSVIRDLSSAQSLERIMGIIRSSARELIGADGITFVLREGDYCYYADENAIAPLWKGRRFPMKICISGWVMLNKQPAVIEDIYADPRIPADAYRPTFVKSLAMVPVRSEDPIAAIGAYWATRRTPDRQEVERLQALADMTAVALANVQLYENLQAALKREQEARQQAEYANRAKDEFLAVLSHELRTPLTPILGWTRILRAAQWDDPHLNHALEVIERNVNAQKRLVEDLLDISRITTGKLQLYLQSIRLATAVEPALETISPAAESKRITIHRSLDLTIAVSGDPDRLQQVAWNLLLNAVKFTPEGGRVTVRVEGVGSTAQLSVEDNGEGIPPEYLPYLFSRFSQADTSIKRSHGGLGLGLSIVRHIVELHGGSVWAESRGKGLGAKFTVRLPAINLNSQPTP